MNNSYNFPANVHRDARDNFHTTINTHSNVKNEVIRVLNSTMRDESKWQLVQSLMSLYFQWKNEMNVEEDRLHLIVMLLWNNHLENVDAYNNDQEYPHSEIRDVYNLEL